MSLTKVASSMLAGGSTGGGGSVGKNYISQYNNGTCNGDFESGNSIGWNLCTVSSISNGLPSGITVGAGSVATSVISTGQIAGQFSLQTIYPNVANQGIITDVFTIDTEDQAKVMTFKFYYNVTSGASNSNFSGTSSNTFIVGIYAVNGSNIGWIQPAGVYSMTQSSGGSGIATGTFQTYSDATQYRFAILCANAPSASVTMVIDDVYLGPQTAPIGAVVTDWVSYTPTLIGVNGVAYTNQTTTGQWRRVGDSIELLINSSFTGTPASGTSYFRWTLPTGLSADTTKVSSVSGAVGVARAFQAAYYTGTVFYESATTIAIAGDTGTGNFWGASSPSAFANTHTISFTARLPVVGFSSNVQLSNDTDTRVVAFNIAATTTTSVPPSSNTKVVFAGTPGVDTHSGWQSANNRYVIPVSGVYRISNLIVTSPSVNFGTNTLLTNIIYINGNNDGTLGWGVGNGTYQFSAYGSTTKNLKAGDFVEIFAFQNTAGTITLANGNSYLNIERLSGPSVIAASETVAYRGERTAGNYVLNNTATLFVPNSTSLDTHNAMNTTTGVYTVPVSGIYEVIFRIPFSTAVSGSVSQASINMATEEVYSYVTTDSTNVNVRTIVVASMRRMNAGSTIGAFVGTNSTSATFRADIPNINMLQIKRIGS